MRTIIFDTETTDIHPGNICQIAYIIVDQGIKARNFFFEVDQMSPSAEKVHGLSIDKLKALSGGRRFQDHIEEIEQDFSRIDVIVGHNVSFDIKFLKEEFRRNGRSFSYQQEFCTMKRFTNVCKIKKPDGSYKYPRLEELIRFFSITEKEIEDKALELFREDSKEYHDARYDTVAAYLCLLRAKKKGLLSL